LSILSITACFFAALLPPPKRETGGMILSIAVPVVFRTPSRKALSIKCLVSSGFNLSSSMIAESSSSLRSFINLR